MTIGEKIKLLRLEHHLSQSELAAQLYVSNQAVSKWERGLSYPDIANPIRFSDIFEVTIDDLLRDKDLKQQLLARKFDEKWIKFND